MKIEYRELDRFPGYRVGNDGSVWSRWQRHVQPGRGSYYTLGEVWRRMKPIPVGKYGHLSVNLKDKKRIRVHHFVLEAFIGPRPKGMECCHDPDPTASNNALSNLRWDYPLGNKADMVRHGRSMKGARHPLAKLTESRVRAMRVEYAAGAVSYQRIADKNGISIGTAWRAINRKSWSNVA